MKCFTQILMTCILVHEVLTDGDAAHLLSWMALASFKSYINMTGSHIRSDRMIAILHDASWCLFNDFTNSSSGDAIIVTKTFKWANLTNVWSCLLMRMLTNTLASSHGQLDPDPWCCWLLKCRRDHDDHHHLHQVYLFFQCTKTEQWNCYR